MDLNTLPTPTVEPILPTANPITARQGDVFAQTVDTGKIAQQTKAFDGQSDAQEAFKIQVSQQVQAQNARAKQIQQEADTLRATNAQTKAQVQQVMSQAGQIKQQAMSAISQAKTAYQNAINEIRQQEADLKKVEAPAPQPVQPTTTTPKVNRAITDQDMRDEITMYQRLNQTAPSEISADKTPNLWSYLAESAIKRVNS